TTVRNRLDEARVSRRIAERFAQALDRCVQAVLEVDEGVVRPQARAQLVAGHDGPRRLQEANQDATRLLLKRDGCAVPMNVAGPEVGSEFAEADDKGRFGRSKMHERTSTPAVPSKTPARGCDGHFICMSSLRHPQTAVAFVS